MDYTTCTLSIRTIKCKFQNSVNVNEINRYVIAAHDTVAMSIALIAFM